MAHIFNQCPGLTSICCYGIIDELKNINKISHNINVHCSRIPSNGGKNMIIFVSPITGT